MGDITDQWSLIFRLLAARSHVAVGILGEDYTALKLRDAGYVVKGNQKGKKDGDLRAINPETGEFFRVEVKTSKCGSDGRYTFRLYNGKHTDCKHTDYIVLNAVGKAGNVVSFVIPTKHICVRHAITITGRADSERVKYSKYRVRGIWCFEDIALLH